MQNIIQYTPHLLISVSFALYYFSPCKILRLHTTGFNDSNCLFNENSLHLAWVKYSFTVQSFKKINHFKN
ncbi:hypothetical protein EGI32_01990 [Ferruginibacter sp. HRS2-29]|nr:hypothetical protein [Ferruginibacter sp. HRS2-29]